MRTGVDVSKWNADWNAEKEKENGSSFVMVRAGYGSGSIDTKAEKHYWGAYAAGLNVGLYWFSYATSITAAKTEAKSVLRFAEGKRIAYPIVFDFEEDSYRYYSQKKGREEVTNQRINDMCKAFCEVVEKAGYYAMFYSNKGWLNTIWGDEVKERFGCWVAHYGEEQKLPKIAQLWQYSAKGIDRDKDVIGVGEIIKRKGLNRIG